MKILQFFLLGWWIHLVQSFRPMGPRHTILMGCDYYIEKGLDLYDTANTRITYIQLEREKGYFWFSPSMDEDEDGYADELAEYIKQTLEPAMKPIDIYSNRAFRKPSFEAKYKTLVERELISVRKTLADVSKIVKVESRYER